MGLHQLKMVELIPDEQLAVTFLPSEIFRTSKKQHCHLTGLFIKILFQ